MADKQGENKPTKLSKRKEILSSKTEQEIFQATKLVTETTSSKPLRLEVNQTAINKGFTYLLTYQTKLV